MLILPSKDFNHLKIILINYKSKLRLCKRILNLLNRNNKKVARQLAKKKAKKDHKKIPKRKIKNKIQKLMINKLRISNKMIIRNKLKMNNNRYLIINRK